jgi:hypothetical protein
MCRQCPLRARNKNVPKVKQKEMDQYYLTPAMDNDDTDSCGPRRSLRKSGTRAIPPAGVAVNRRARALIRAGGGRMAASAALLRPFGERHALEYDRAAVRAVEHAFSTHHVGHDLDLLLEIATKLPHLQFADFWHGYLRYLAAEAMLRSGRQRQHL